jgi:hypothetical protein
MDSLFFFFENLHGQLSLPLYMTDVLNSNTYRFCRSDFGPNNNIIGREWRSSLSEQQGAAAASRQFPHSLLNSSRRQRRPLPGPCIFIGFQGHTDILAPQIETLVPLYQRSRMWIMESVQKISEMRLSLDHSLQIERGEEREVCCRAWGLSSSCRCVVVWCCVAVPAEPFISIQAFVMFCAGWILIPGSMALFCRSCFGLFQLVSAYSLSQNTIESAETSRLFHQPNQPNIHHLTSEAIWLQTYASREDFF